MYVARGYLCGDENWAFAHKSITFSDKSITGVIKLVEECFDLGLLRPSSKHFVGEYRIYFEDTKVIDGFEYCDGLYRSRQT